VTCSDGGCAQRCGQDQDRRQDQDWETRQGVVSGFRARSVQDGGVRLAESFGAAVPWQPFSVVTAIKNKTRTEENRERGEPDLLLLLR